MITARDMATAAWLFAGSAAGCGGAARRTAILLIMLFVTVLASSVAFIEPSPHDALMGVLAIACLVAGRAFPASAGCAVPACCWCGISPACWRSCPWSGRKRPSSTPPRRFISRSQRLLFACLFAQNTCRGSQPCATAYVLTALSSRLAGIAGYFSCSRRA